MTVEWLAGQSKGHNIQLAETQKQQFQAYYRLLVEWNEKMSLTSIIDERNIYLEHFYDSIAPNFYFDFNQPMSICDVGAGVGFPSTSLKIMFPQLKMTVADSLNRRIQSLNHLASELQLQDVNFIHDRAETSGKGVYKESYDVVTTGTVARLSVSSELCLSLIKRGGQLVASESSKGEEKLEEAELAISVLDGNVAGTHIFELPEDAGEYRVFIIGKRRQTPGKYPRKPRTSNEAPLLER